MGRRGRAPHHHVARPCPHGTRLRRTGGCAGGRLPHPLPRHDRPRPVAMEPGPRRRVPTGFLRPPRPRSRGQPVAYARALGRYLNGWRHRHARGRHDAARPNIASGRQ
ncbi:hypothetical protein G6F22_021620 [Rhizopus arrhizus]|nr:hypothetical protein G6F22_021620 [Rhizopus arrhizus]